MTERTAIREDDYRKPLPTVTPWSAPFWEGCRRGELLVQVCQDCRSYIFYPKMYCPDCLSSHLEWVRVTGKGKVYSYMVVHAFQPTEFADDVPYVVAIVDLDEGVRMMSNIVGCDPETVRCDMRVEVVFEKVTDGFTLPKFRPAAAPGA